MLQLTPMNCLFSRKTCGDVPQDLHVNDSVSGANSSCDALDAVAARMTPKICMVSDLVPPPPREEG
jgi:hypothetical protein